MRLRFSEAAETDLAAALLFYEAQAEGLGLRLLANINETCSSLRLFPHSGRVAFGDLRKIKVDRFPFGVVYKVIDDAVVVHAIVDLRRDPEAIEDDLQSRDI